MTDATELDEAVAPWEETWRPIDGCDGYEVSDFGNVRSHWSKGNHKQKRAAYPHTLRPRDNGNGYAYVSLPNPGGGFGNRAVHRLVAEAFIGPAPDGSEVAHLNGDSTDARACNLAYVTHVENETHKREHGTHGAGERNSQAKLQGWQVAEVKYLAAKSVPQARIADLFGMDRRTVSAILNGKAWASVDARTDVGLLLAALDEERAQVERLHFDLDREARARQAAERDRGAWRSAASAYRRTSEGYARLHRTAVSRAEDYEGRYETAHASRMHAEDCYHAELARAEAAESALAAVRALADEWEAKQSRNRAHYIDGPIPLPTSPNLPLMETFEPVSELRAALATPTTTDTTTEGDRA